MAQMLTNRVQGTAWSEYAMGYHMHAVHNWWSVSSTVGANLVIPCGTGVQDQI